MEWKFGSGVGCAVIEQVDNVAPCALGGLVLLGRQRAEGNTKGTVDRSGVIQ